MNLRCRWRLFWLPIDLLTSIVTSVGTVAPLVGDESAAQAACAADDDFLDDFHQEPRYDDRHPMRCQQQELAMTPHPM
eukprot:5651225-Amphidinium_carterae.2